MGNVVNMKRQAGDPSQEIQEGLEEYEESRTRVLTEEEYRQAFAPRHRPWDQNWAGPCPYESIPDPGYKERFKPSLIDRLTPYILIAGFLGFCYACIWLGYLLMGVAD